MIKSYSKARIFRQSGVAFLLGIVFSYFFTFKIFLLIFPFFVFFYLLKRKTIPILVFLLIFLSFFVGFLRFKSACRLLNFNLSNFNISKENTFYIVFSEEAENYQKIIIKPPDFSFKGGIIYTDLRPKYYKGEVIRVEKGKFEKIAKPYYTSGLFITFKFLNPQIEKIKSGNFYTKFAILKEKIKNIFNYYLKEPQASLLNSLVFGRKGNLEKEIEEKLNLSGLSHLVAVSGLHLVLLTKIIIDFLNNFSLKRIIKYFILFFLLLVFAFLADFTPSISRALIMATLLIFAELNFRIYHPLNSLILTLIIMVYLNPFVLFYDFGFELSFLATLGIITFSPLLGKWQFFEKEIFKKQLKIFKDTFVTTSSSLILVYPLIVLKTGKITLLSLISNLLVVPLISYILIFALILIFVSFLTLPSLVIAFILNGFLSYLLLVSSFFSSLKPFIVFIPYKLKWLFVIFYFLIAFYYVKLKKEKLFLDKND